MNLTDANELMDWMHNQSIKPFEPIKKNAASYFEDTPQTDSGIEEYDFPNIVDLMTKLNMHRKDQDIDYARPFAIEIFKNKPAKEPKGDDACASSEIPDFVYVF